MDSPTTFLAPRLPGTPVFSAKILDNLWHRRRLTDASAAWPVDQLADLRETPVWNWGISTSNRGAGEAAAQLRGWMELSAACLNTAFILSQHIAAVSRIAASPNAAVKRHVPEYQSGQRMASVGISHLSTSRQHLGSPAVSLKPTSAGWELSGEIPWVTGATAVDDLVVGAVDSDGSQFLFLVERTRPGVKVRQPEQLLALNATQTASLDVDRLHVSEDDRLIGPVANALQVGSSSGTGSLTTTAIALGAATPSLAGLKEQGSRRPELASVASALIEDWQAIVNDMFRVPESTSATPEQSNALRLRANSLIVRAALAGLSASKGAGFVHSHPASEAIREALFFQVWSCPQAVVTATLGELSRNCELRDFSDTGTLI